MKLKQVIVVTKLHHSALRKKTRHIHKETLKNVVSFLKTSSVRYRVVDRKKLTRPMRADLIVTVGGDGTALAASHFAGRTPLLGINSAPETSTGFFCLANPKTFRRHLKNILEGKRKPAALPRLEVTLNGVKLPHLVLNEILFAAPSQGETARYCLCVGHRKEKQKSSGVWVATGAGSTAAIFSAGGKKDFPFSKRFQYLVREPFRFPKNRYRCTRGFLPSGRRLTLISEMGQARIFIDGSRLCYSVPKNGILTIRGGLKPLKIFL